MVAPDARTSAGTAEQILDLAEELIQTRGYSAFSYQDISTALAIAKASIHYHFPSKAELGVAVIERYAARFGAGLRAIGQDPTKSSIDMIDFYVEPYRGLARTPDRVCLCGALAGEVLALPLSMRESVARFFREHQNWLADVLDRGVKRGEFALSGSPQRIARAVFGALQGALLVKRTTGDASELEDVITVLKAQLLGTGTYPHQ